MALTEPFPLRDHRVLRIGTTVYFGSLADAIIQDAIKFPDIIHVVKQEPDRGFPQDELSSAPLQPGSREVAPQRQPRDEHTGQPGKVSPPIGASTSPE